MHSSRKAGEDVRQYQVDKFYLDGKEEGKQGRGMENNIKIIVAVEEKGKNTGRVRLKAIDDTSSKSLLSFIESNFTENSKIKTDG